jgi:hypothetical protein
MWRDSCDSIRVKIVELDQFDTAARSWSDDEIVFLPVGAFEAFSNGATQLVNGAIPLEIFLVAAEVDHGNVEGAGSDPDKDLQHGERVGDSRDGDRTTLSISHDSDSL